MSDSDIELDYQYLTQIALRRVIHDVLSITQDLGDTPGEHHFLIEFLTGAPGVKIPDSLKEEYPERMTIVLQHLFEGLEVNEEEFSVTLRFGGVVTDLTIPFQAITKFIDPHTEFALQFEPVLAEETDQSVEDEQTAQSEQENDTADKSGETSAEVVTLDSFRKK